MAFSEDIKTRTMVACGRCCCICHKFCGNNMEVHHIRARADGGTDTYDNAIPLCFDCHAEVRQYDPKHPKGIRFTEKELIQHRDNWYKAIASNGEKEATTDAEYKPVKILREKGHEDILLHCISTGQELVAIMDGCFAMECSYEEPKTAEEAEEISKFIQIVNDQLDCLDEYEPSYRVVIAFSLNESISSLNNAGFLPFMAVEKRVLTGGITNAKEPCPTLLLRIVRKDSDEIIKRENT